MGTNGPRKWPGIANPVPIGQSGANPPIRCQSANPVPILCQSCANPVPIGQSCANPVPIGQSCANRPIWCQSGANRAFCHLCKSYFKLPVQCHPANAVPICQPIANIAYYCMPVSPSVNGRVVSDSLQLKVDWHSIGIQSSQSWIFGRQMCI